MSLSRRLRPLSWRRVVDAGRSVARADFSAHRIVHCPVAFSGLSPSHTRRFEAWDGNRPASAECDRHVFGVRPDRGGCSAPAWSSIVHACMSGDPRADCHWVVGCFEGFGLRSDGPHRSEHDAAFGGSRFFGSWLAMPASEFGASAPVGDFDAGPLGSPARWAKPCRPSNKSFISGGITADWSRGSPCAAPRGGPRWCNPPFGVWVCSVRGFVCS